MYLLSLFSALIWHARTAYAAITGIEAATFVGGQLSGVADGDFGTIAAYVAYYALPFMNIAAVLVIVIAGTLAIVAQDEGRIGNARKVTIMALVAIVLINVSARIANAYMVAFNFDQGANPVGGANLLSYELLGAINFIETPVVLFAIISIIAYGIKAVVDYNGENGQQAFKKAILSILLGILIIVVKYIIAGSIVSGNPAGIITPAVLTLFTILGFVALVAVVIIASAGIYLIVNLGDETRAEKAKGVILSITAGLIFMAVITALLAILINGLF